MSFMKWPTVKLSTLFIFNLMKERNNRHFAWKTMSDWFDDCEHRLPNIPIVRDHERCNATPCATPSSESGETRHQRKKLFTQGKGTCTKNSKPACLTSGRQRRIIFQCVFKGARCPTPPHATPLTAQVGSYAWLRCNRCQ